MMPSLFVSHGSPTILMEEDSPARAFLRGLGNALPRPKAIVAISAHWESPQTEITTSAQPKIIHDFYGFPKELYKYTYSPTGDLDLAKKIQHIIKAKPNPKRGFDHGIWAPISLMYPDADIPIVQISLRHGQPSTYHYDIGKALAPLRKEGVLILASGAVTHNLRTLEWYKNTPDAWAQEMENWFVQAITDTDHDTLLNAKISAPNFSQAHPTSEHWMPLYVALGAAQEKATILHSGFEHKNLSMAAARFD